ncbi:MAG: serine hydrolase [Myxococcota bacterium]|nr:serine hydrolase [Myxococcota bacterium]
MICRRYGVLALGVSLFGCSAAPAQPSHLAVAAPDAATEAGHDASASVTDDGRNAVSPAEQRLAWIVAALNGAAVTDADITANFDAAFLSAVPATQLRALIGALSAYKPWKLAGFEGTVTPTSLTAIVIRDDGEYARVGIIVDGFAPYLVSTASISPAGDLDPSLATYTAVESAVAALGPGADMLAANIDATGACVPLHAFNAGSNLALGSAFKLWVLAALAESVASGARAWTDTVAIDDRYKSLPSGTLQTVPAGTAFPLLTFAGQMISVSDNTAADHLLFTVGRLAVEAMLARTGHHDPAVDQPFLSTRELFAIKLLLSPADQQAYVSASSDVRRTLLATYDLTLDPRSATTNSWTMPILVDRVEWFATQADLCGVMAALKGYGEKPATKSVLDVLALNPGIPAPAGLFAYVGFKGGSEPGVLDLTWLLRRASDQSWAFFSVGWNDANKPINEDRAAYVAGAGRALLAR